MARAAACADVARRVEVRLADDEVDDRAALAAELVGAVGGGCAGRWLDAPHALGDPDGIHDVSNRIIEAGLTISPPLDRGQDDFALPL